MTTKINLAEVKVGDVFSEQSHYVYEGRNGHTHKFKHLESGNVINLDNKYVEDLLDTADQYQKEIKVGKEDKRWTKKQIEDAKNSGEISSISSVREGDVRQEGIRSIWASIHSKQVFTVNFNKQSKELSNKQLTEMKNKQLQEAVAKITEAQKNKKGVAKVAEEAIVAIQQSPILPLQKGEERILRGYKTQFSSITGQYDVIDMDLNEKRIVNVNEINWLVIGGIKYTVE